MEESVSNVADNDTAVKVMSERLTCPLCLDVYKQPRSLACLHTFCETCIYSVIQLNVGLWTRKNEIVCSVCQHRTLVPDVTLSWEDWAKSLPLNQVVLSSSSAAETERERNEEKKCDLCALENQSVDAELFCVQCNIYQCRRCIKAHSRFPTMKGHEMIDLQDLKSKHKVTLGKVEFCEHHPKNSLDHFCQDHSQLCCCTCIGLLHEKCKNVKKVEELGEKINSEEKPSQLQTEMDVIQTEFDDVIEKMEMSAVDFKKQNDEVKKDLQKMRDAAVKKIDEIVLHASKHNDTLVEEMQEKVTEKIQENRRMKSAVSTSRFMLQSVLEHGTDSQLFITTQKSEAQCKYYKERVASEREGVSTMELKLELGSQMENLINAPLYSTRPIVEERFSKPLAEYQTKIERYFEFPTDSTSSRLISGLVSFPNGCLAVVYYSENVCYLMDNEFNILAEVGLPGSPFDMIMTAKHELAVSILNKNLIQFISVGCDSLTLSKTVECKRKPRCLAQVSEADVAVGWNNAGIGIISSETGEEKLYLSKDTSGREIKFEDHDRIAVNAGKSCFYKTSWKQHDVFGIDFTGKSIFTFKRNSLQPSGITLDRDGNVLVCSCGLDKIFQLSHEGKSVRKINIGLQRSYAICFSSIGNRMIIGDTHANTKLVSISFASP